MQIIGPESYKLKFDPSRYFVICSKGTDQFSGLASTDAPKLYIISVDRAPIYVGITKQRMRTRLTGGWKASGKNGYYGYAWRHHLGEADLHIWAHQNAAERSELDIETVEAEVVFLIRQSGQWPAFQTEIHFHPSSTIHREAAQTIYAHFRPALKTS